jgi:hypothetical protein
MTVVVVYVDTSKQVGDPDYLKVFANADAAGRMVHPTELVSLWPHPEPSGPAEATDANIQWRKIGVNRRA